MFFNDGLTLGVIIHVHQIANGCHIICDIAVSMNGVFDNTAGYSEIHHIHGLIVVHHCVN